MLRNEKGFIYPLVFLLLLLCTIFITIHTELYITEKKYKSEVINQLEKEYYFKLAVQKIEKMLQETDEETTNGIFHFKDGTVGYVITEKSEEQMKISLELTRTGKTTVNGVALYDITQKKLTKWEDE